jgi:hypothetical protein
MNNNLVIFKFGPVQIHQISEKYVKFINRPNPASSIRDGASRLPATA